LPWLGNPAADPAHHLDAWVVEILAKLPPRALDVNVNKVRAGIEVAVPNVFCKSELA
jgi:hypothetical protein